MTGCGRHEARDRYVGGARCKHGSYYGGGCGSYSGIARWNHLSWGDKVSGRLTAGAVAQARRPSEAGGQLCHHFQGSLLPGEVSRLGGVRKVMCTALKVHASHW